MQIAYFALLKVTVHISMWDVLSRISWVRRNNGQTASKQHTDAI